MARRQANRPDDTRVALAHALGYLDYPVNRTAEPYLNYVSNRHIGRGTLQQYLALFLRIIAHFSDIRSDMGNAQRSDSVQALLDRLSTSEDEELFADTKPGSKMRKEDVEDTVMYILGAWTMMLSSFVQLPNGVRKVVLAYNGRAHAQGIAETAYEEPLAGLVRGSGLLLSPRSSDDSQIIDQDNEIVRTAMKLVTLLSGSNNASKSSNANLRSSFSPSFFEKSDSGTSSRLMVYSSLDDMDSLESLSIKAARLNAFTLSVLGAAQIQWTYNVSRHMLLSRHGGRHVLELFALPCVFSAPSLTSDAVGISSELAQEIQESYCILFNAWHDTPLHAKLGAYLGIRQFCWCWSCSADRYRSRVLRHLQKASKSSPRGFIRRRNESAESEFDPQLVELMNSNESSDWTHDLFPSLWPRITALEEHLQSAKPWSIWVLFRDRRDTLQFWTFFFATIVVMLTFMQVALGVAQVVGSFN